MKPSLLPQGSSLIILSDTLSTSDLVNLTTVELQARSFVLGFINLFRLARKILDELNDIGTEWDLLAVCDLQMEIDEFCRLYRSLIVNSTVTNYVLDLQSGMVSFFLLRYGNVARLSNQSVEYSIGATRSFVLKRTQNFGSAGPKGHRCFYPVAKAVMNWSVRKFCFLIAQSKQNTGLVKEIVEKGKEILKEKKNNRIVNARIV